MTFTTRFLPLVIICATLLPVVMTGCGGPPMGTVSGTVTINDKPYSASDVMFLDLKTGQAASGEVQPDGTFTLSQELPLGAYTVYLAPKAVPEAADPAPVKIDTSIPDKYWNEASSDIKVEVKEGPNQVQVALTR